jgi:23S rRNA (uracil1939-C5)-methyltransferase
MFEYIKNILKNINAKNVIDLYCGCGSISLYIADTVDYIYGIEINESSINDANENKIINNINNVDFLCNTSDNIKISNNFDTVIVDPPRSGLSKTLINKLISSKICNIIYVSCDPITLVRDLDLLSYKYNINSIKLFNMFPRTYHCESVCILERK